jgi:endoglucanase
MEGFVVWGTFRSCCGDDSGNLEPGTKAGNGSLPGYVSLASLNIVDFDVLLVSSGYDTIWANAIRPKIPNTLKRSGISSLN